MPENSHQDNQNKYPIHHKIKSKLPSEKKKLLSLALIALAIPLTVALALVQQIYFSRASEPTQDTTLQASAASRQLLGQRQS